MYAFPFVGSKYVQFAEHILKNITGGGTFIISYPLGGNMSRSYALYKVLGGIINEKDYLSVFERAVNLSALDLKSKQVINSIQQAEEIARHAKIEIDDSWDAFDLRIVLYVILRNDVMLAGTEYHHSQMHDQRLFVEALRMLGDVASLGKLIEAYPKISFS